MNSKLKRKNDKQRNRLETGMFFVDVFIDMLLFVPGLVLRLFRFLF